MSIATHIYQMLVIALLIEAPDQYVLRSFSEYKRPPTLIVTCYISGRSCYELLAAWGLTHCTDQDLSGVETEPRVSELLRECQEAQTYDALLVKDLDALGNQIQAWTYEIGKYENSSNVKDVGYQIITLLTLNVV